MRPARLKEECGAADEVVVDVVGRNLLCRKKSGPRMRTETMRVEESDADEAPEVMEALMKERGEAGGGAGEVAEEGSGNEEEVDEEIERDGGVAVELRLRRWDVSLRWRMDSATVPRSKPLVRALGGERVVEKGA